MTNLDSILKSRDITLPTKVCLVKAMVFPVVMFGCESWTVKKAECRRIDAFELWCWRRLLRVPWTARRSNQSILKEISPGCSLEGLMLKLKLQYFGHLMGRADSLEKTLMLGGIGGRRRRGRQRMRWLDGITTRWTWVWVNSGSLWWTGRSGVLRFMGSQRVRHDWVTELKKSLSTPCLNLTTWTGIFRCPQIHYWFLTVFAMIRCFFYAPKESASVTKPLGQSFSHSQERKTNQSILLHLLLPDFCLDGQKELWEDSWNSGGERSPTWQPGTCTYPCDGGSMWKFKVSDCGPAKPSWALSPRGHPDRLAGARCPPPVPCSTPAARRGQCGPARGGAHQEACGQVAPSLSTPPARSKMSRVKERDFFFKRVWRFSLLQGVGHCCDGQSGKKSRNLLSISSKRQESFWLHCRSVIGLGEIEMRCFYACPLHPS